MQALPTIAVFGGKKVSERALEQASAAGALVARLGCNLLTGAGAGVMEAAAGGFCKTERVRRSVGIIPGWVEGEASYLSATTRLNAGRPKLYPNPWIEIPVFTHLPGDTPFDRNSRNYINALSSDLVIAVEGGAGTTAEIEIARALGKPVFVWLEDGQTIGSHSIADLQKAGVAAFQGEEGILKAVTAECA